MAEPIWVDATRDTVVAARAFSYGGTPALSIVTKVVLDLGRERIATMIPADPIVVREVPFRPSSFQSIVRADEVALQKVACDVTLVGRAVAPGEVPARTLRARLALFRAGVPIVEKSVVAHGGLDGAGQPNLIQSTTLAWELALGGAGAGPAVAERNPVGTDRPWIIEPERPDRPAGFGPIGNLWPSRAKLAKGSSVELLQDRPSLPTSFPWAYFQSAPAELQVPFLDGDEWLHLDGFDAARVSVRVQLPQLEASAVVFSQGSPIQAPHVLDTLAIDTDAWRATVLFRGVAMGVAPAADTLVISRVATGGASAALPDVETARSRAKPLSLITLKSAPRTLIGASPQPGTKDAGAPFHIAAAPSAPPSAPPGGVLPWKEVRGHVAPSATAQRSTMDLDPAALARAIQSFAPPVTVTGPTPSAPSRAPAAADEGVELPHLERELTPPPRVWHVAAELRAAGLSEEKVREIITDLEALPR